MPGVVRCTLSSPRPSPPRRDFGRSRLSRSKNRATDQKYTDAACVEIASHCVHGRPENIRFPCRAIGLARLSLSLPVALGDRAPPRGAGPIPPGRRRAGDPAQVLDRRPRPMREKRPWPRRRSRSPAGTILPGPCAVGCCAGWPGSTSPWNSCPAAMPRPGRSCSTCRRPSWCRASTMAASRSGTRSPSPNISTRSVPRPASCRRRPTSAPAAARSRRRCMAASSTCARRCR